ncbi:pantetheine-phosphate adenylyltransferase [Fimbriimonas ginsengisoli]|uniref:Phosphopantetheine adenylyltransferase n=1 Tax=Fimbriimonas ginsengisoli Gsoil 348 TaxID=661478 RepID=A0A068NPE6_FIMGI|nr:pantetheine-phosphate adenylyltransferase [Fimbriimonas ginsengisoli]AIE85247.1 Phosphopantetheine adenylyltransferase [Fimbriimonas ginsengisoli Gsoil 348]
MRSVAIYPGSFDPPTLGHLDVIERASRLFDTLIVSIGSNSQKRPLLSLDDRLEALRRSVEHLPNVTVETFSGLLVEYALSKEVKSIVRGLRATADFEYEFQMAMVNRRLSDEVDTVFLMTKWEYSYLSSSIVREVAVLGGDYQGMVPAPVAEKMSKVLAKGG